LLAAFGQLARLEPHRRPRLGVGAFVAALQARRPAVAAHLQVVAAVERSLVVELLPVAALAEHFQPFFPQQLGDVAALEFRQESMHLGGRHVLQPQGKAPVFEPWLEHVMIQLLRVLRELDRIAGAIGVEGAEQRVIAAVAGKGRRSGQVSATLAPSIFF